ncbi:MAG TPA: glycosyltransferase [Candidatus Acidoferrales bacterium]|jgi:glycosyltransferase involved in cell wall biosynthesis|nr:glycosyltransferase [Candidatus Acidoferrales bacterium]
MKVRRAPREGKLVRIIQVSRAMTVGDAVSNQMASMHAIFQRLGYDSQMYADRIDPCVSSQVRELSSLNPYEDSLLIYHFSTGTKVTARILEHPYPVALYYHNITPAKFHFGNAWGSFFHSLQGRKQLANLARKVVFAWAASEYSRQELEISGFRCTAVCPIIVDREKYQIPMVEALYRKYNDGRLNILFVGRMAPHKCQHDLIEVVYRYQKKFGKGIRLLLVGASKRRYRAKLEKLIAGYDLRDVAILTGKVSLPELCTYYRVCDLFLSMSEHEGFGVPLIESMIFNKPVFAYSAAAVPEVVGKAGVLFASKDFDAIVTMIHERAGDDSLERERCQRLNAFCSDTVSRKLAADLHTIAACIGKK